MAVVVSSSNRKKHRQVSFLSMLLIFIIVATIAFVLGNDFSSSKLEDSNPELIDATKDAESKTKNISKAITEETSNKQTNKNDNAQPKASTQTTTTDKSSNITQVQEDNTSTITKDNEKPKKDIPQFPVEIKHFNNEVDNQLEIVSRKNFGSFFTPFVDMTDEEALAYLQAPIQIFETDDEKTIEMKERTAAMKTEALAYIKAGNGNLNDYLRDYAIAAKETSETMRDIRFEMRRILRDEGEEAARIYLEEVNPQLQEAGLPLLKLGALEVRAMERYKKRQNQKKSEE